MLDSVQTDSVTQAIHLLAGMRCVDLGPRLEKGMPRWPTHPHLTIDKACTHEHDGYYCQAVMLAEHTGSHVDAPAHSLPDRMDQTIDVFPANYLISAAVLYDLADRNMGPGDLVTPDMLLECERRSGAKVGAGEIALVNFGWMKRYWHTDSRALWYVKNSPGINEEAVLLLKGRGVRAVGTDTVGGDTPVVNGVGGIDTAHMKHWLPNGILIMEMLTNLEQLSPRSIFVATPLNIHEGSGSPIRPVAYCPQ